MSRQWYEHPSLILQLKDLAKARDDLREKNLFEGDGIRPKEDLGKPTDEVDVHVIIEREYHYRVFYRLVGQEVFVIRILHGRQD